MSECDKNEAFSSPMEVVFSWTSPEDGGSKRKSQDDSGYVSPFSANKRSTVEGTPYLRNNEKDIIPYIERPEARKRLILTQAKAPRSELPSLVEGVASYSEWEESLYSEPMELDTPCLSSASQDDLKESLAALEVSKDLDDTIACCPQTPTCSPIRKTAASDFIPATPRKRLVPIKRDVASAPTELWQRRIPRRNLTGVEKVDFLLRLGVKSNFPDIISKIFDYLPDSDLSNVTMVSKTWKNACFADPKAHGRWRRYVSERKQNRENLNLQHTVSFIKERKPSLGDHNQNHSTPLVVRQQTSPPVSPNRARFNTLCKVSRNLKRDEVLVMCPQCRRPYACAASSRFAECASQFCHYKFCRICKGTSHPNRECPVLSPSTPTTPTKRYDVRKARRNLRRL